ncbi:MAG: GNAT family N-acetyltransferase [Sedimentisphaerales bacterium]|nr:GNAT family N-acetyltransferase [Sedimentisphaerales bacterium]
MSQDIRIRLARERDAGAIADFNIAMARETEDKELSGDIVVRGVQKLMGNSNHGFYVVADRAGELVGSLMITYEWSDWRCAVFWWIQSVYVRPDCRRQGVFTRLYEFVRTRALQTGGVCGLRLYFERNNETAETAYGRLGMTKTGYGIFEEALNP